jgi:osmotically-inducible protein OsmY
MLLCASTLAEQGVVERAGETIDNVGRGLKRGVVELTDSVRAKFDAVRADVHRMETQPRVYSRLHWDKRLHSAKIEVHMLRDGSVLLRGVVADETARQCAVALARDTVDVKGVVDELTTVMPPLDAKTPAGR